MSSARIYKIDIYRNSPLSRCVCFTLEHHAPRSTAHKLLAGVKRTGKTATKHRSRNVVTMLSESEEILHRISILRSLSFTFNYLIKLSPSNFSTIDSRKRTSEREMELCNRFLFLGVVFLCMEAKPLL